MITVSTDGSCLNWCTNSPTLQAKLREMTASEENSFILIFIRNSDSIIIPFIFIWNSNSIANCISNTTCFPSFQNCNSVCMASSLRLKLTIPSFDARSVISCHTSRKSWNFSYLVRAVRCVVRRLFLVGCNWAGIGECSRVFRNQCTIVIEHQTCWIQDLGYGNWRDVCMGAPSIGHFKAQQFLMSIPLYDLALASFNSRRVTLAAYDVKTEVIPLTTWSSLFKNFNIYPLAFCKNIFLPVFIICLFVRVWAIFSAVNWLCLHWL